MDVLVTILLGVIGLLLYSLNESNKRNSTLNDKLSKQEIFQPYRETPPPMPYSQTPSSYLQDYPRPEPKIVREVIVKPIYVKPTTQNFAATPLPSEKRFVQVIFKKGDKKRYDYFLGDNYDVKVGDFVEVWANNKRTGKQEWNVVKVLYVSKPGEISTKAKSTIIKKAIYPKW